MKLQTFFKKNKQLIDDFLIDFIQQKAEQVKLTSLEQIDQGLFFRLKTYVTGGKTIRGSLVVLGYELFNQKYLQLAPLEQQNLLKLAAVVELTHSMFLIQDDILDLDDLRRGQAALHAQYRQLGQSLDLEHELGHFGDCLAVMASDLLIFWAQELLGSLEIKADQFKKISLIYSQEMVHTVYGEMADFYFASVRSDIKPKQIKEMMLYKTARYSLVNPLLLGASLAGANQAQTELLIELAQNLGLIFQIKDDELGLFAQQDTLGKPVGSDIKEGKETLFKALLFDQANQAELVKLKQIFGQSDLNLEQITYVRELLGKYEVVAQLQTEVAELAQVVRQQIKKLSELGAKIQAQQLLGQLLEYLLTRTK